MENEKGKNNKETREGMVQVFTRYRRGKDGTLMDAHQYGLKAWSFWVTEADHQAYLEKKKAKQKEARRKKKQDQDNDDKKDNA